MYYPLDGPAVYGAKTVTTTAQEIKVGVSALSERKVISMQPIGGDIYYGYDSSVTVSTGTKIEDGSYFAMEATNKLPVWMVSSGSVNVRITEVA